MGDYFKGWRRKVGVVTLVMAVTLAGMWVRSLHYGVQAWFTIRNRMHFLTSAGGQLAWGAADANETRSLGFPAFGMQPYERGPEPDVSQAFRWEFNSERWAISHYVVIALLTLLSAYLLLWPSRRAKPEARSDGNRP